MHPLSTHGLSGTTAALLALLVVMTAAFVNTPAAQAETLLVDTTNVAVGGLPNDVVVDMQRGLAYVSITDNDEIVSADMTTGAILARHFFSKPTGLELSADNQYLYVALNSSTGISRVKLADWTSTEITLPELGDRRTWDVIETSPGVVLVSANPGSNGLAWIVRYNFDTAAAERVADDTIIRAGPRFAIDNGNYVYVGAGFSPNSLYRLDLSTPLFDIVAEDDHGSVGGTQSLAVSPDGSFVVIGSGQKLDASTLTQIGDFEPGVPLFDDSGARLYSLYEDRIQGRLLVSVSDSATTQLIEQWEPDCGSAQDLRATPAFTKGFGSSVLLATTEDSLCLIHTTTVRERPLPDGGRFFDDDASVHETSIEAIAAEGITRGCNPPYQTGYCPNDPVTREQMAAFLVRALGLTDTGGGNSFIDDDGSIFEGDIARLAAAGITRGCNPPTNTMFCPQDVVTRGQMAAFLVRALGYPRSPTDLFVDDDGSVFETDIDALGSAGVTLGCNPPANTSFCPNEPVTRAQMATFLTRALELPVREVPIRLATVNGTDLEVIQSSSGCTGSDGEVCTISRSVNGEFYLLTGWISEDWSSMTPAEQSAFQTAKFRIEATFDGVPIDLVAWPFEVVDDMGIKTYSYQFPDWLQGSHILEVRFVDDTENFVWTIRDTLTTYGDGYAQTEEAAPAPDTTVTGEQATGHLATP
ncbi:MAG: S-layer homology domain-containing protein [Actinomycetota bacterium]|nr:S-layer homology domain-containing protein [Actinomycetota bacterium]